MRIIGLSGGTESQRNMVSTFMKINYNVPTINIKKVSENLNGKDNFFSKSAADKFGPEILNQDGTLNKSYILDRIKDGEETFSREISELAEKAIAHLVDEGFKELEEQGYKVILVNYGPEPHFKYGEEILIGELEEAVDGVYTIIDNLEVELPIIWEKIEAQNE